jgi:translation initiation factor IF-2
LAKNLKLNIKNTQLAEALKLGQIKRPAAKKKKAESQEPLPEAAAPSPEKVEAVAPPPVEKKVAPPEPPKAAEPVAPPPSAPPPARTEHQAAPERPPARRDHYSQPARPHYQQAGRPPFVRRDSRPPARPPMGAPTAPPPRKEQPSRMEVPPAKKPLEDDKSVRKAPGFKEYRDVKPQRKLEPGKRSFDSRDKQGLRSGDDEGWRKRRPSQKFRSIEEDVVVRPKQLSIRLPITVKDLAAEMKLKASQLISKLFMQGVVLTLNDFLDDETTLQLLGHEFDCEITLDTKEEERLRITDKTIKQEVQETDPSLLIIRPPVIAFMGHVDHGKTSLIDAIRKANTAAGEAGAITQHIGAFKCHTPVGDIAILDTPGHEAFSAMRTRGADVTDIVVLVIAGDEGIRTQTLEAMQQAQNANVPIVVALSKADKPNFNADNVYRQLADQNLLPETWGGTTITVNCSAVTGVGIKELLEMLALQSEILELKANPKARARGTVVESEMHKGLGAVATVLVQNGTLRLGDALVFGHNWARVKTMHDEHGKELVEAGPSTPAKITGLSGLPAAGSEFIVVKNEREARVLAEGRTEGHKHTQLQQTKRAPLEGFLQQKAEHAEKKTLNLILRADVQGSLEALKTSLLKIASSKVDVNVISAAVGEISESDIQLAAASKATILGFHTQVESHAEGLIKQNKVIVKLHDIIYHAVDDVRKVMLNLLDKIPQETDTGAALVKTIFKASQLGVIAGCQVTEGTIKRNQHVRVIRDNAVVWKGSIASLKRVKEDVREVSKGYECGILLQNFNEVKEGDILQAYEITYLEQEL